MSVLREVLTVSFWDRKEGNCKRNQEKLPGMSCFVWILCCFSICPLYSVQFCRVPTG